MSKITLGEIYVDPITMFRGAAVATIQEINAGEGVFLQPAVNDNGGMIPAHRFPVDRVIAVCSNGVIEDTTINENHSTGEEDNVPTPPNTDVSDDNVPNPPVDTTVEVGIDLDIDGVPWNEGIHSSGRSKTKEGRWARRRNITDELYNEVTAELQRENGTQVGAVIGAITGNAPDAPPTAETKQEQTTMMTKEPPTTGTPLAGGTLYPPKGREGVELAQRVGRLSMKKIVSIQEVDVMAQTFGLDNYRALLDKNAEEFIPLINQMLDEAVAATGKDENA